MKKTTIKLSSTDLSEKKNTNINSKRINKNENKISIKITDYMIF
ncbi:hypothetical protein [Clostridium niameyense]|nr:hypothetical protein [Clostridium niameyense]